MFSKLQELIPAGGTLSLSLSRVDDERMAVSVLPVFPEKAGHSNALLKPCTMTATAQELEGGFVDALVERMGPEVRDMTSAIEVAVEQMRAQKKSVQDKAKPKAKGKDKGGKDEPVDRTKGEIEEQVVEVLKGDVGAEGYDKTLRSANLPSLMAALNFAPPLANQRKLAAEIDRAGGKAEREEPLTTLYKSMGDGDERTKVGKELEKVTGKTLADLGLAEAQISMF